MPLHQTNPGKNTMPGSKLTISRLRSIGNSKGVILNSQIIKAAGIDLNADVSIEANKGTIIISQAKASVNTDLSSWDAHFKKAIAVGNKPEGDLFEGLENKFDNQEW